MARLMRKARRNRTKVAQRNQSLKLLKRQPVIKKIDVEDLKNQSSGKSVVEKATKEVKKVVDKVTGKGTEKAEEGTKE